MSSDAGGMTADEAFELWARLSAEGTAPSELVRASHVLPSYSVAIQPWLDRLTALFLRRLCRRNAHFKLVMAPYGGGKTHFLLALGARALEENYAVAYVPCIDNVGFDSPLDVHRALMRTLLLPGEDEPGVQKLIERTVRKKRQEITNHGVPDVDLALGRWIDSIRGRSYPENAFGRVMAAALHDENEPVASSIGDAAVRWLQGDIETLGKEEMRELKLARIPARSKPEFGRNLLFSSVKFLPELGAHGLVLLMDEVETLFTARGKPLLRVLAAMRVLLDAPAGTPGGLPLFGVFSAVPDIIDQLPKYPALQQRLAVVGATFQEGSDLAIQLPLDEVEHQETLLAEVGRKLIDVGSLATGHAFDAHLQTSNAKRLAVVASSHNLDVDARRLYVKTWASLLEIQRVHGERTFDSEELLQRYRGIFDQVRRSESGGAEP